jgi:hypothetical protein
LSHEERDESQIREAYVNGRVLSRSRRKPDVSYRLVLVEWEDSARPIGAWQWIEDYQIPEIVGCISVGYLIAETKRAIALAPNLGDIGRERVQAIRIPHSAVRRMIEL